MTHPKAGEWWCPGRWRGQDDDGREMHAGCDGDSSCPICKGLPMHEALEGRTEHRAWAERAWNQWQGRALRGWANLMASRYGRPVYLTGGALKDSHPRDIDVRVVLSVSEYTARFGKAKDFGRSISAEPSEQDDARRWHVEIAKMNVAGAAHTRLPVDFQVQPITEAMRYVNERRKRLDDVPDLKPPWED